MNYALIMGSSGGIGRACALRLASEGWSLYCHYATNSVGVKELVRELQDSYPKQDFFAVQLDMTKTEQLPEFLAGIFSIDAIIFAAGPTVYKLLLETREEDIDTLWKIHVKTPLMLCSYLQDKLAQSTQGRIVFISSIYGLVGSAMETVYSSLKGAQIAFTKAYAKEVSTLDITVNAIAPGAVDSPMNHDWSSEEITKLQAEIPMGRLAQPVEIAHAVSWLLTKDSQYMTGAVLPVTGGWLG